MYVISMRIFHCQLISWDVLEKPWLLPWWSLGAASHLVGGAITIWL